MKRYIKSDATDDIITPAYSDYFDALEDLLDRFNVQYRDSYVVNGGRIFYIEPGQVEFKHPNSGEYVPLLKAELYADGTVYLSDKKHGGGWSTIHIPLEEVFVKVNDRYINYLTEDKPINSSRKPVKSGYKISPLEWANRWIPEIYDQRKFMQLCEQKGISKIDSEEFFKLMDEFGFKSNGKIFEYDASKYLYNSRKSIKSSYNSWDDFYKKGCKLGLDSYMNSLDELHDKYGRFRDVPKEELSAILKNIPDDEYETYQFIEDMLDYFDWYDMINSSRRPVKSSFVIEHWHPLLPQTQYVCVTDEGFGGTYNVNEALQFDTMMEAKQFIKEREEYYGGKLKIHEYPSYVRNSRRPIKSSWLEVDVMGIADRVADIEDYDEASKVLARYLNPFNYGLNTRDELIKAIKHILMKQGAPSFDEDDYVRYSYAGDIRSSRQIKSARYIATDPESGEVLGSADTYEEAVNEWGEDVTITDSEAAEGQGEDTGLFSSWDNDTPRGEGWLAHDDGKQKGECPYERGTEEYEDWIDGWEAAYQEVNSSRRPVKSSFDDKDDDTIDVEVLAEELVKEGYEPDIVEQIKDKWINEYSISELTDDEDRDFRRDVERLALNSSKEPIGDKAFLSNIVSSFANGSMTEEQAVKRIALRNNCNQAFARNILSSAIEDSTLIQSGTMEIAEDLNKDFNVDGDIESWSEDYIPESGKANTIGGEILRATAQIANRFYNDGDKIGIGNGKETVNPAARYIIENAVELTGVPDELQDMLNNNSDINISDESYEEWVDDFKYAIEDYLRNHEELFHSPNKVDMWDFKDESDTKVAVDDIFIEDEDGSRYFFQGGPEGWHCYDIYYANNPKYNVGDIVNSEDVKTAGGDTDEEFVTFSIDGFTYSAELYDNDEYEITDIDFDGQLVHKDEEWSTEELEKYQIYDSSNNSELSIEDLY